MQKKLIALAVAGLVSGGAFAQSNVTIQGQFKEAFENVRATGAATSAADLTSRNRVTDHNSWLRFSGEEALGNGTSAWFQIESAIGTSDNVGTTGSAAPAVASSATLGTRNTAVGLKGAWGNVLMGKWDVYYQTLAPVDGGWAGNMPLSTSSLNLTHTNGQGNGFGGRLNNVVAYITPNMNGLSAVIGWAGSGTATNENTTAGLQGKETGWTFNPSYVNGPISVFYAYLKATNVGATTGTAANASGLEATANRLGAAYTFPFGLKIGFVWDKNKLATGDGSAIAGLAVTGGAATASLRQRTAWTIPVNFNTGANTFYFTYGKANNVQTQLGDQANTGAKMMVLAYDYALSKRTAVNVSWSSVTNDPNAKYDFWHPSSNVGAQSATGLPAGADPRAVIFGIRHQF